VFDFNEEISGGEMPLSMKGLMVVKILIVMIFSKIGFEFQENFKDTIVRLYNQLHFHFSDKCKNFKK
jgi:hypothetical protein